MTEVTPTVNPAGLERLLEMTGNDPAFLDELVQTYLEDAAAQLDALRAAAQLDSPEDMVRPAHSLKGNSLNVGAEQLAEVCRQIEVDARAGRVDRPGGRVAVAAAEFARVKAELMRLRSAG